MTLKKKKQWRFEINYESASFMIYQSLTFKEALKLALENDGKPHVQYGKLIEIRIFREVS